MSDAEQPLRHGTVGEMGLPGFQDTASGAYIMLPGNCNYRADKGGHRPRSRSE